jgi:hypothetical protein
MNTRTRKHQNEKCKNMLSDQFAKDNETFSLIYNQLKHVFINGPVSVKRRKLSSGTNVLSSSFNNHFFLGKDVLKLISDYLNPCITNYAYVQYYTLPIQITHVIGDMHFRGELLVSGKTLNAKLYYRLALLKNTLKSDSEIKYSSNDITVVKLEDEKYKDVFVIKMINNEHLYLKEPNIIVNNIVTRSILSEYDYSFALNYHQSITQDTLSRQNYLEPNDLPIQVPLKKNVFTDVFMYKCNCGMLLDGTDYYLEFPWHNKKLPAGDSKKSIDCVFFGNNDKNKSIQPHFANVQIPQKSIEMYNPSIIEVLSILKTNYIFVIFCLKNESPAWFVNVLTNEWHLITLINCHPIVPFYSHFHKKIFIANRTNKMISISVPHSFFIEP